MATKKTADQNVEENTLTLDRRRDERRNKDAEAVDTTASGTSQRKKQRRRHIDPTTCERDYNDQEIEFMRAMDDYKHASGRMFPTCSEVLEVIRNLGYVQLNDEQIEEFGLEIAVASTTVEESETDFAEV